VFTKIVEKTHVCLTAFTPSIINAFSLGWYYLSPKEFSTVLEHLLRRID
jgi:hypothetical protein